MDGSRPRVLYALPQSQTMLHKMDVLNIYSSVVASKDGGRKGGREALQRPSLELRESLGEWGGRFVLKSGAIPKPRFCFQDTAAQQLHFDHLLCALNDGLGHLSQEASSPREMNRVSCAASCVATRKHYDRRATHSMPQYAGPRRNKGASGAQGQHIHCLRDRCMMNAFVNHHKACSIAPPCETRAKDARFSSRLDTARAIRCKQ
jgi:hypothetical protein